MRKCPTCGKPVEGQENPWRPFCSERCKLIDFGRWANEEYRVPSQHINPPEVTERPGADESDEDDQSSR
ncbi:MAG: DNA gyrase inhibitor YacG [Acidobacteria bacterium]|nr:MAG: DNA gyrase inhibitor YacG [Acidobacteriota bacterium]